MRDTKSELHMHTKMSRMRGLISPKELVEYAIDNKYKALAVTDVGSVQAFPEVYHTWQKHYREYEEECIRRGDIVRDDLFLKVIYGVEVYLTDDSGQIVNLKSCDRCFLDEYVVVDMETTGLSSEHDRILKIDAVRMKNGEPEDSFSEYIRYGGEIPEKTTTLIGIDNSITDQAGEEEKVLTDFLDFSGDAVFVSYAPEFDMAFLEQAFKRHNQSFDPEYVDLRKACKAILPQLGRYTKDAVARALKVDMEQKKGAFLYAEIFGVLCGRMSELGIKTAVGLNSFGIGRGFSDMDHKTYPVLLYARNEAGIRELYRLISYSQRDEKTGVLEVNRSRLQSIRENLLVGAVCDGGELSLGVRNGNTEEELKEVASFYDFLEITPYCTYETFPDSEKGMYRTDDEKKIILQRIYRVGKGSNIPVIMTSDACYINPEDKICREILLEADNAIESVYKRPAHIKNAHEFLHTISVAGSDIHMGEAEKYLKRSMDRITGLIEQVSPLREGRFLPVYPDAEHGLTRICYEKAHELYGSVLPKEVKQRLEEETDAICHNGYAGIYMLWRDLVEKSISDGYPVGIRGSVGASLVAYLLGITITNPLKAHYRCGKCCYSSFDADSGIVGMIGADLPQKACPVCGEILLQDGYSIPHETFMSLKLDKEPDIDLNFAYNEQPVIQKYVSSLPGIGYACKAGTIGTMAERTAEGMVRRHFMGSESGMPEKSRTDEIIRKLTGVRRVNSQHPGGIIVVPEGEELTSFTPINNAYSLTEPVTTHFDYHSIDDNLLKLDVLGNCDPEMLRNLREMTGVDPFSVPVNDEKVLSLFLGLDALGIRPEDIGGESLGLLAIPEFGGKYARDMIRGISPKTVTELVKIDGLLHGTDVWTDNAKELIESGTADINNCIGTRDDIFQYLMLHGFERDMAFCIMEAVRKGYGLSKVWQSGMQERSIPDWYIESCNKIRYLFPKAHAASYTRMALMIAWYKVYYPSEFYTAWLERNEMNKAEERLLDPERVQNLIEEYEKNEPRRAPRLRRELYEAKNTRSRRRREETDHLTYAKDSELERLYVFREMFARGIQPNRCIPSHPQI